MKTLDTTAIVFLLAGSAVAQGTGTRILPNDGSANDFFGVVVDADGTTAIVGASGDDNSAGLNAGAAYLFSTESGQQLVKLAPNDLHAKDLFGFDVAIDGNRAVASSVWDDDNGARSGSMYVFDATTGAQLQKLIPTDGAEFDNFGNAIAIDGNLAVGTSPWDADNGIDSGSAYVFDINTGVQISKLLPTDGEEMDLFGYNSVAISGNTVAVGCFQDDRLGHSSGTVYLFEADTGTQFASYLGSDEGEGSAFGYSLAMSGSLMLVGAFGDSTNGLQSGAAYLFDFSTGTELGKLMPSDGEALDAFGFAVGIDGDRVIIGAEGDRENGEWSGSAYLYSADTLVEFEKITPQDGAIEDRFGRDVAMGDGVAIAGALYDDDNGTNSGSAYLIDVVAPADNTGSAFCFGDGSGGSCPCPASGFPGEGCGNSTGHGARLFATGNAAIVGDTFALSVEEAPANKPGLVIRGRNQLSGGQGNVLGDGLLCTSGQVARSQVLSTSSGGTATFSNFQGGDFGAASYGAGIAVHYQFWYRDPQFGCSGMGFNLSNAWTVTWQP